jgi:hypothetical protein
MEAEELVFDEMMGRWVSTEQYEEFINLMLKETNLQHEIKNGIESNSYSEYNLRVIQDIASERNSK